MKRNAGLLIAVLNFCTLVIGLTCGFFAGSWHQQVVSAQVLAPAPAPTSPPIEEVSPMISAGSAAFGTLLAGRVAADEIAVRGIDLLKLHQNVLNLLASKPIFFSQAEISAVINNSRADKILQMKPQPAPQPTPQPAPQPEKPKEGAK
jgi:hypothetical protein